MTNKHVGKDTKMKRVETVSLTQKSMTLTVSTLESDLNSKNQEANARRKEDAETTKRELAKIEEMVTKCLMHLELNIKMLVTKFGVTPSNTLPLAVLGKIPVTMVGEAMHAADDPTSDGDRQRDLYGNF